MTLKRRGKYRGPRLATYSPRRKAADVVWLGLEALGAELCRGGLGADVPGGVSVSVPALASDDEFEVVAAVVEDTCPGVELVKELDPPAWRFVSQSVGDVEDHAG